MGSFTIASKEWVIRQYDHEVRGRTVIKPLQGRINNESHGDATVIKPLEDSFRGLAVSANVNPRFMERNPYWGAISTIDETCRNLVCVGAKPDALLDCLNFGNPEKPEKMGEFYEACRGLGDAARTLHLPFMSGNVSFYNESKQTAVPPTSEITGIGIVEDIRTCVTSDLKKKGDLLYLVGAETKEEMGGSQYHKILGVDGGHVPIADLSLLSTCVDGLLSIMKKKHIVACHDCSEGGIAVALAEMCIGGRLGCSCDIRNIGNNIRSDIALFSESNTRWIVEVSKNRKDDFERMASQIKIPWVFLGSVGSENIVIRNESDVLIDQKISHLDRIWRRAIPDIMG